MADAPEVYLAPPAPKPASAQIAQFFIPAAASLQERRPRTLKHGDTFALFDHNGDALAGPGNPEGIYHRDTRYLSYLHLTVGGARPLLLSSTIREDNATLTCDLTNPDLYDAKGRLALEHDLVHIRRSCFLWRATCFERLAVRNFDEKTHRLRIELGFAADFADLFEVRGNTRERRGDQHRPEIGGAGVVLSYTGLDDVLRRTRLGFDPKPVEIDGGRAAFELELVPRATAIVFATIECEAGREPRPRAPSFMGALRDARRALRKSSARAAAITTANDVFNESIRRAVSDLYMLITDTPEGAYPYAGIPWFSTVFGRDGLVTALETLWFDPSIPRACSATSPPIKRGPRTRRPTPSREKSCTRSAPARWRNSAKCRSGAITAAWIPRRCF
jgi:glycogen debranching enzyme